jgi:hypothetical protein
VRTLALAWPFVLPLITASAVALALVWQHIAIADFCKEAREGALAAFDPSGLIFGAGAFVRDRHMIKLYDARQFA